MDLDEALHDSDTTMPEEAEPLNGILGIALLPLVALGMAATAVGLIRDRLQPR